MLMTTSSLHIDAGFSVHVLPSTNHEDNQPLHLPLKDAAVPADIICSVYGAPSAFLSAGRCTSFETGETRSNVIVPYSFGLLCGVHGTTAEHFLLQADHEQPGIERQFAGLEHASAARCARLRLSQREGQQAFRPIEHNRLQPQISPIAASLGLSIHGVSRTSRGAAACGKNRS